jgi:hypothetical protein
MPKRIIDGDALWVSEKLTLVPVKYRAEYAWILPLAQVNGCFECSPMLVWRTCYSALRSGWTVAKVAKMLNAFEAAKMLFRFQQDGKTYGFFVGIQKEGRLPRPSDRIRSIKFWQQGLVPEEELASFLGVTVAKVREDYHDEIATNSRVGRGGVAEDTRRIRGEVAETPLTGIGIGKGKGEGEGEGEGSSSGISSGTGEQPTPDQEEEDEPGTQVTIDATYALADQLLSLFGKLDPAPSQAIRENNVRRLYPLVVAHTTLLGEALTWARNDSWWGPKLLGATFPASYFVKSYDSIVLAMATPPRTNLYMTKEDPTPDQTTPTSDDAAEPDYDIPRD